MSTFCKGWLVCGAFALAIGGCGDSGQHDIPISTAGTGLGGGQSGSGLQPAPAGMGNATAGAVGTATAGAAANAGSRAVPPSAGTTAAGASGKATGGNGATAGGSGSAAGAGGTLVAGAGGMGMAGGAPATAGTGGTDMTSAQALPAVTDYTQKGPFKTLVTPNAGPGSGYTIYRPDPLGADGFLHSPIIFGPGIATSCAPGGALNVYTDLLNHFASHGFVVICVNSMSGGPGDPGNLDAMKMGLDWLIAQNSTAGVFQGKLAVKRAITMGYSIGATASMQLSSHEAIMTTVAIHGHMQMTSGKPHGPALLLTGTNDVIDQVRATIAAVNTAPMLMVALPIGHLDVPTEIAVRGRYIAPLTAWLRYWVNGDQAAKSYFSGTDCKLCGSPWITPEPNAMWKAQMP